jgi:hypothetical protein
MGDLRESMVLGTKSGQYCVLGVSRYKWYQSQVAQPEMVGACTNPMKDASGDARSKDGVIVTSHIAWE